MQLEDTRLVDGRDRDRTPLYIDDLSGSGHASEHLDHVPADGGLTGVLDLDAELVLDVSQRRCPRDHEDVAVTADLDVVLAVFLFLELADDLLEDVLEEIVGEFEEEEDGEHDIEIRRDGDVLVVAGTAPLGDVEDELGIE